LSADLRELSKAIREDGNDGAHQGTLTKGDAEDLLDFTVALLKRVYTEPKQLELAEERRKQRRAPKTWLLGDARGHPAEAVSGPPDVRTAG
jgi:hypothetical protein